MADFMTAHRETMGNEGGYANNPNDVGGETYKGVARKYHPGWSGWKLVDTIKAGMTSQPRYGTESYYNWARHFNKLAAENTALQRAVVDFYSTNFWKANRLGEINNQAVANQMYDWAVNTGSRGNKWVQRALGLVDDGAIGPKSIEAINTADPKEFMPKAREFAKEHRLKVCEKNPSQKQFLAGWLRRDGFGPDEIKEIVA